MGKIYYVSSNDNKYKETKEVIEHETGKIEIVQVKHKINEVQHEDPLLILRDKTIKAFNHVRRPVIVEQTCLFIPEFANLPGGLTQVFWDSLKAAKFCEFFSTKEIIARTAISYCDGIRIKVFQGEIVGRVSDSPHGDQTFQWDCIFIPSGYTQTFSEMGPIKNEISMRRLALVGFIDWYLGEQL